MSSTAPATPHDSRGAGEFILDCLDAVTDALPGARIEARLDSAFFSDEIVSILSQRGVEFSISAPFDRLAELKARIAQRKRWHPIDDDVAFFEERWKPKAWAKPFRFIFLRQTRHFADKGPIQLDLFVPYETGRELKVIVTNKTTTAASVLAFHNGRGSQEAVFADLKGDCHMDYVAVRRLHGNQTYLLAALLAHNLNRELQMSTRAPERRTNEKRCALWAFQTLATLRRTLVQRAGRLSRPKGRLTLTISANDEVQRDLLALLDALPNAA
jgi:hypothetical protein